MHPRLKVELLLTQENLNEVVEFNYGLITFKLTRLELLNYLIKKNQKSLYLKDNEYDIEFLAKELNLNSPPIPLAILLRNDIVSRPSIHTQKLTPELMFVPLIKNEQRVIQSRLAYIPQETANQELRYNVMNAKSSILDKKKADVGSGSFSGVYDVIFTLDNSKKPISKMNNERILKSILKDVPRGNEEAELKKEHHLQQIVSNPKAKGVTRYKRQNTLLLFNTQEKVGNLTLSDILKNPQKYKLTNAERFILSIEVLEAIIDLYHRGVVSKDIKPGNIVLNRDDLRAKIIDLGLGKKIISNIVKLCGTPGYTAPETADTPSDEYADLFAIGIVLAEIWGKPTFSLEEALREFKNIIATKGHIDLSQLFTKLTDDEKNKLKDFLPLIKKAITELTYTNKAERKRGEDILPCFENMLLDYTFPEKTKAYREDAKATILKARQLRNELPAINYPDEYLIEHFTQCIEQLNEKGDFENPILVAARILEDSFQTFIESYQEEIIEKNAVSKERTNQLTYYVTETKKMLGVLKKELNIEGSRPQLLKAAIEPVVTELTDDAGIVTLFVDKLKLDCFKTTKDKSSLLLKLEDITQTADKNLETLDKLKENIQFINSKDIPADFLDNFNLIYYKFHKSNLSLDKYAELNNRFKDALIELEEGLRKLLAKSKQDKFQAYSEALINVKSTLSNLTMSSQVRNSFEKRINKLISRVNNEEEFHNDEITEISNQLKLSPLWPCLEDLFTLKNIITGIENLSSNDVHPFLKELQAEINLQLDLLTEVDENLISVKQIEAQKIETQWKIENLRTRTQDALKAAPANILARLKNTRAKDLIEKMEELETLQDAILFFETLKRNDNWLRDGSSFMRLFTSAINKTPWENIIKALQEKTLGLLEKKGAPPSDWEDKQLMQLFAEKLQPFNFQYRFASIK